MVLACPAAILTLFVLELNSTLHQGLPSNPSTIPVENHELLVSESLPQGSTFDSNFNNVHIFHVQEDPAYNPFFALNKQSSVLYNRISINLTQSNTSFVGTFLMAVTKQNQSQVETLYCVTYCIGNLSNPAVHEACYDSVTLRALQVTRNESLLSQHIYEQNIGHHTPVGYPVLQLALISGNKSNVSFSVVNCNPRPFFIDSHGVLRTGRNDLAVYVLKIAASATVLGIPRLDLAFVTVNVTGENNLFRPTFEQPNGYTFSVKEEGEGLSVGFVKAFDRDEGLSGKLAYSLGKQEDASFFQLNQTSGEIKTAVALDRETDDSHIFTVIATDQGHPKSLSSQVQVRVLVEDINDNPPVFAKNEYSLSLSLYTEPGLFLTVNAADADVGENAKMVYTIIEGNDKELFWINSTSGELFLVAPLTAIAEDSIVLVVRAQSAVPVNSSSQDTTRVRMWFYDVVTTAAKETSVALTSGLSVGCALFVAALVAVSLYIWRKRRKIAQKRRREYQILPDRSIIEMATDYDRMIKTDRRVPSTVYHVARDPSSQIGLEDIEMESSSKSEPPEAPTLESRSRQLQGAEVSLDLSRKEYKSEVNMRSPEPLSSEPISHSESVELEQSHLKDSQFSLDLSAMETEPTVSIPDESFLTACKEIVPLSRCKAAFPGSWSFLLSIPSQFFKSEESDQESRSSWEDDEFSLADKGDTCKIKESTLPDIRSVQFETPSVELAPSETSSSKQPPRQASEILQIDLPASPSMTPSGSDDSFLPSCKEIVPLSRCETDFPDSWSFLLSIPSQFFQGEESDKGSRSSWEDNEFSLADEDDTCKFKGSPPSSSSVDSFRSSSSEDVPLRRYKAALTGSFSFLQSIPSYFSRSEETDKESSSLLEDGEVLHADEDDTRKIKGSPPSSSSGDSIRSSSSEDIPPGRYKTALTGSMSFLQSISSHFEKSEKTDKESSSSLKDGEVLYADEDDAHKITAPAIPRLSAVDSDSESVEPSPSAAQLRRDKSLLEKRSESTPGKGSFVSLDLGGIEGLSLSDLQPPSQRSEQLHSTILPFGRSSHQAATHRSEASILSSHHLLRHASSSPSVLARENLAGTAEKTLSQERKGEIEHERFANLQPLSPRSEHLQATIVPSRSTDVAFSHVEVGLSSTEFEKISRKDTCVSVYLPGKESKSLLTLQFSQRRFGSSSDQAIIDTSGAPIGSCDHVLRQVKCSPSLLHDERTNTGSMEFQAKSSEGPHISLDVHEIDSVSLTAVRFPERRFGSLSEKAINHKSEANTFSSDRRLRQVKSSPCLLAREILADSAEETLSQERKRGIEHKSPADLQPPTQESEVLEFTIAPSRSVDATGCQLDMDLSNVEFETKSIEGWHVSLERERVESKSLSTVRFSKREFGSSSEQAISHTSEAPIGSCDDVLRQVKSSPCVLAGETMVYSAEEKPSKERSESSLGTKIPSSFLPAQTTEHSESSLQSSSSVDSFRSSSSESVPRNRYETALTGPWWSFLQSIPSQFFQSEESEKESRSSWEDNEFFSADEDDTCKIKGSPSSSSSVDSFRSSFNEDIPLSRYKTALTGSLSVLQSPSYFLRSKETDKESSSSVEDGEILCADEDETRKIKAPALPDLGALHSETRSPESSPSATQLWRDRLLHDERTDTGSMEFQAKSSEGPQIRLDVHKIDSVSLTAVRLPERRFGSLSEKAINHKSEANTFSSDRRLRQVKSSPCLLAREILADSAKETLSQERKRGIEHKSPADLQPPTQESEVLEFTIAPSRSVDATGCQLDMDLSNVEFETKSIEGWHVSLELERVESISLSTVRFSKREFGSSSDQAISHTSEAPISSCDHVLRQVKSSPCVLAGETIVYSAEEKPSKEGSESSLGTKIPSSFLPAQTTEHPESSLHSSSSADSFRSSSSEGVPLGRYETALTGPWWSFSQSIPSQFFQSEESDKESRSLWEDNEFSSADEDDTCKIKGSPSSSSSVDSFRSSFSEDIPLSRQKTALTGSLSVLQSPSYFLRSKETDKESSSSVEDGEILCADEDETRKIKAPALPDLGALHSETRSLESSPSATQLWRDRLLHDERTDTGSMEFQAKSSEGPQISLDVHKIDSVSLTAVRFPEHRFGSLSEKAINHTSEAKTFISDRRLRQVKSSPCLLAREILADSAEETLSQERKRGIEHKSPADLQPPTQESEVLEFTIAPSRSVDATGCQLDMDLSNVEFETKSIEGWHVSLELERVESKSLSAVRFSKREFGSSSDQAISQTFEAPVGSCDDVLRQVKSSPCVLAGETVVYSAEEKPSKEGSESSLGTKIPSSFLPAQTTEHLESSLQSSSSADSFTSSSSEGVPLGRYETALTGPRWSFSQSIPSQFFQSEESDKESRSSWEDHEFFSADEDDTCKIKGLPSSSSSVDSFRSSFSEDIPLSRQKTALTGSLSVLQSPSCFLRSKETDKESSSSVEDGEILCADEDETRKIKAPVLPDLGALHSETRSLESSPSATQLWRDRLLHDERTDTGSMEFQAKSSEGPQISLDVHKIDSVSLTAVRFPERRFGSLSEKAINHTSEAKTFSSDRRLRQVKSSPCLLAREILADSAEETLSQERKRGIEHKSPADLQPPTQESEVLEFTIAPSRSVDATGCQLDMDLSNVEFETKSIEGWHVSLERERVESKSLSTVRFSKREFGSSSEQAISHTSEAPIGSCDDVLRQVKSSPCVLAGETMVYSAEEKPSKERSESSLGTKIPSSFLPAQTTEHSESSLQSSSSVDSFRSSSSESVPRNRYETALTGPWWSFLQSIPSQFFQSEESEKESRSSWEDNEFFSADEDDTCKIKGSPSSSSSVDSFRSSFNEDIPLSRYKTALTGSLSVLQSPSYFLRSKETDKESSSSVEDGEILCADEDETRKIKAPALPDLGALHSETRSPESSPSATQLWRDRLLHDERTDTGSMEFQAKSSEGPQIRLDVHKIDSVSLTAVRLPERRFGSLSEKAINHKSEANTFSSDRRLRQVKSSPCLLAREILADSAKETLSQERKRGIEHKSPADLQPPTQESEVLEFTIAPSRSVDATGCQLDMDLSNVEFETKSIEGWHVSLELERVESISLSTVRFSKREFGSSSDQAISHTSEAPISSCDHVLRQVKSSPCVLAGETIVYSAEEKPSKEGSESSLGTKIPSSFLPAQTTEHPESSLHSSSSADSFRSSSSEGVPLGRYETALTGPWWSFSQSIPSQFFQSEESDKESRSLWEDNEFSSADEDDTCKIKGSPSSSSSVDSFRSSFSEDIPLSRQKTALTGSLSVLQSPSYFLRSKETDKESSSSVEDGEILCADEDETRKIKAPALPDLGALHSETRSLESSPSATQLWRDRLLHDERTDTGSMEFQAKSSEGPQISLDVHKIDSVSLTAVRFPEHRFGSLSEKAINHTSEAKTFISDRRLRQVKSSPCLLAREILADSAEETLSQERKRGIEHKSPADLQPPTQESEVLEFTIAPSRSVDATGCQLDMDLSNVEFETKSIEGWHVSLELERVESKSLSAVRFSKREFGSSSDQAISQTFEAPVGSCDDVLRQVKTSPCVLAGETVVYSAEEKPSKEGSESSLGTKIPSSFLPAQTTEHLESSLQSSSSVDSFRSSSSEGVPLGRYETALTGPRWSFSQSIPSQFFQSEESDKESRSSWEDHEFFSADEDDTCKIKGSPSSSSSVDSFRSSFSEDIPLSRQKTALTGSLSVLQSPSCFLRSKETDKESSSSVEDGEILCADEDETRKIKAPVLPDLGALHSETRSLESSPSATQLWRDRLLHDERTDTGSMEFQAKSSEGPQISLDVHKIDSVSLTAVRFPERRFGSLSEKAINHTSEAKTFSSDRRLRQVKSSPCLLAREILADSAEETLSQERKRGIEHKSPADLQPPTQESEVLEFTIVPSRSVDATGCQLDMDLSSVEFETKSIEGWHVSLERERVESKSLSAVQFSKRGFGSSSDQAITRKSEENISRTDYLFRQVKSCPSVLAGEIVADSAEETLSDNSKELLIQTKLSRAFFPATTTGVSEPPHPSYSSVESLTSSSSGDIPLTRYKTAVTGSWSFLQLTPSKSQSSRGDETRKESSSSLDHDEFISADEDDICNTTASESESVEPLPSEVQLSIDGTLHDKQRKEYYVSPDLCGIKGESPEDLQPPSQRSETKSIEDSFGSLDLHGVESKSLLSVRLSKRRFGGSSDLAITHKSEAKILKSDYLLRQVKSCPTVLAGKIIADSGEEAKARKELSVDTNIPSALLRAPTAEYMESLLPSSSHVDSIGSCASEDVALCKYKTDTLSFFQSIPSQFFNREEMDMESSSSWEEDEFSSGDEDDIGIHKASALPDHRARDSKDSSTLVAVEAQDEVYTVSATRKINSMSEAEVQSTPPSSTQLNDGLILERDPPRTTRDSTSSIDDSSQAGLDLHGVDVETEAHSADPS